MKILKKFLCILCIFIYSINSFCEIVSDNDGSAFITKAEFDALKSSFQSQIDEYNTSIDSKIDSAIAAYLAGIKIESVSNKEMKFNSYYDIPFTFKNNDYFAQYYQSSNSYGNGYILNFISYANTYRAGYNGCFLLIFNLSSPNSYFDYMVNAKYDNEIQSYIFSSESINCIDKWQLVGHYSSYNWTKLAYITIAWKKEQNNTKWKFAPTSFNLNATRDTHYVGYSESSIISRSYDEALNYSTDSTWNQSISANSGTRLFNGSWNSKSKYHFINDIILPRYVEFDSAKYEFTMNTGIKWNASIKSHSTTGYYSGSKGEFAGGNFSNIYYPIFSPSASLSGDTSSLKYSGIYASNLVNKIKTNFTKGVEYIYPNFSDGVLLDIVDNDYKSLSFNFKTSGSDDFTNKLIISKKQFKGSDVPSDAVPFMIVNDGVDSKEEVLSLDLCNNKTHTIKIMEPKKDDIYYFKLIPNEASEVIIEDISAGFYESIV